MGGETIASDPLQMNHNDPFRMRQVLGNLISNAIKFTKEVCIHIIVLPLISYLTSSLKGHVLLRASAEFISEAHEDFVLHVDVQDTGV